jgi:site-specific recombinase XerD
MLQTAKKIPSELSMKTYLYEIPKALRDTYNKLVQNNPDRDITPVDLKNVFQGKSIEKPITINDVASFHIEHFKKRVLAQEVAEGTEKKYERVINIFRDFLKTRGKNTNPLIDEINDEMIFDFDDYLRYERPNGKENFGVNNNTAVKYIRNLKTIFNFCLMRKFIRNNPFDIYDKQLEEVETVFLDELELKKFSEVELESQKLNSVRDIFLFSCFTSYAPVDAMKLTKKNIETDIDGDKWIRAFRQKSKVKSDIVVLPPVNKIIKKYENDPRCVYSGKLLPTYSNQKMNEYLKEIAEKAEITKHLTWYVSRHTFATTVCLNNKMPLEYVSAAMGHKKITQTQHYAKLLDKNLKEETLKLITKYE